MIAQLGVDLIVRTVQESIDRGRAIEEQGHNPSRNALQTITLLDALAEFRFEAVLGGARRDEEKSRAKERFFSHRDRFGQRDPKTNGRNSGRFTMGANSRVRVSGFSHSVTGPKWMCGNIFA